MSRVADFDVLILGAGLSGINMAARLRREMPMTSFAILEQRERIGGTWDLFRYPGVRSDSDMFTLGYGFRPWDGRHAIAEGADIRDYIARTAREYSVDQHIRFQRKVVAADWSSEAQWWSVTAERTDTGEVEQFTARFLINGTGYYRYEAGFTPDFPGFDTFGGRVIHPQHWPGDFDPAGKRIVVIGSGATAVTLIPSLSLRGADVVQLQRTPTYIISQPRNYRAAPLARIFFGRKRGAKVIHRAYASGTTALYLFCRRFPKLAAKAIRSRAKRDLPADFDYDRHLTPPYKPWDQRLCVIPDGELFEAYGRDNVEVVTDEIETFDETGIQLKSGRHLDADVVITATGLDVRPGGGAALSIDGEPVVLGDRLAYKAMMVDGVPNFAFLIGYINASWTLKVDLVTAYLVRLLRHLDERGLATATPRAPESVTPDGTVFDMDAGYLIRARHLMPKAASTAPAWKARNNWIEDRRYFRRGDLTEDMELSAARDRSPSVSP